jgi:hypothetical protein
MTETSFYGIVAASLSLVFLGAVLEQKLNTREPFFEDGMPLGVLRAGEVISGRTIGGVVSGDVRAGEDLAIVLLNGKVYLRNNEIVPAPCGMRDPFAPTDPTPECPVAMVDVKPGEATVTGLNLFGGYQ